MNWHLKQYLDQRLSLTARFMRYAPQRDTLAGRLMLFHDLTLSDGKRILPYAWMPCCKSFGVLGELVRDTTLSFNAQVVRFGDNLQSDMPMFDYKLAHPTQISVVGLPPLRSN